MIYRPPAAKPIVSPDAPAHAAPAGPSRSFVRLLDWPNSLAVLALAVFVASFAVRNSDYWLHLASGRLIAAGAYPFGLDPFSALDPAPVWINHAWLFDLLLYLLERSAGGAAVVMAKATLIAALAAIMLSMRRPGSDGWLPVLLTALSLLAMAPRLYMQPIVVSLLFLGMLLFILQRSAGERRPAPQPARWRLLVFIAVLFVLWVNLDGGFWFGLIALALWTLGGLLHKAVPFGAASDLEVAPADRAAALAAALFACLINPYGYKAFTLPSDWAFLTLPGELHNVELFRGFFRTPLKDYAATYAGTIPASAYFLLLGLGLGSFVLNAGGWRWDRALIWLAFALGSLWLARLVPLFAVVAGPITVLNLQDFAARRPLTPRDARAAYTRAFVGGLGRFVTLLAALGLLALAWPGGLADDAGTAQQRRRVDWSVAPDESWVQAANQLEEWYHAGKLVPGEARGFHLPIEFGYYCAWYCPAEKMLFDIRMTNPSAATAVVAVRAALQAFRDGREAPPEPPDPRTGPTHLVLAGPIATSWGRSVLSRPDRFPLWAIAGQSLITAWCGGGFAEPYPALRLDPVRLAANEPKTPAPNSFPDPPAPDAWERFRAAPQPVPAEAHEAALWLTARQAAMDRFAPAITLAQLSASIGRAMPAGPSDGANRLLDPFVMGQFIQALAEPAWQRGPDGRLARVAPLLAVRAARRGILANPDDYEVYLRLWAAYSALDSDQEAVRLGQPSLNQLQQITAARQALARIPLAALYGRTVIDDEYLLNAVLVQQYEQSTVFEGLNVQPLDFKAECFARLVQLDPEHYLRQAVLVVPEQRSEFQKAAEEEMRKHKEKLADLQRDVKRRSDELENRAAKVSALERARMAAAFGLPREALRVLLSIDLKRLIRREAESSIQMLISLLLLAGEANDAHTILQGESFNPVTVMRPDLQPAFRALNLKTAAALGDPLSALDALEPSIQAGPASAASPLAGVMQWLIFPDLGFSPLTRAATSAFWFGIWPKDAQPTVGSLLQTQFALQQYGDNLVRQGLLALECGDVPLAKRRFRKALEVAGQFPFALRGPALRWLDLFRD